MRLNQNEHCLFIDMSLAVSLPGMLHIDLILSFTSRYASSFQDYISSHLSNVFFNFSKHITESILTSPHSFYLFFRHKLNTRAILYPHNLSEPGQSIMIDTYHNILFSVISILLIHILIAVIIQSCQLT